MSNTSLDTISTSQVLAHLCFPTWKTRGRRYAQPAHPYRDAYQRDRDRIIHARAFRRLEHKTQVFTTPHSDHFRNRLTHTIEVSQIARTVAATLGLNQDLVEALALSHDIGHPPFGHSGEKVLDEKMRRYGEHFDHNLHALRIVETFEQRYAAFPGLNLTFEVREGIVKHSRDLSAESPPELQEYLLDQRPLLEAQLIDPADEITYNCADFDDGVDAGFLEVATARRTVPLFDRLMRDAEQGYPRAPGRQLFNEALRKLLDQLVSGLIEGTRQAVEQAGVRTPEDVRRHAARLASLAPETAAASHQLKELLYHHLYRSPELDRARKETDRKVAELFEFFVDQPRNLPKSYQEQCEREPVHRVVCDYIAGMTDKFLLKQHKELL